MAHPQSSIRPAGRTASDAGIDVQGAGALSDYPAALIEVTLERVIASNTFRRSQRHRRFLIHLIRAGLAGQRDQLKEVIIGIEVFDRAMSTYDPRRDPIVRVEAGRIRDKLARYYEGEGAGEAFQIVIPIGNYLPLFVRRKVGSHAAQHTYSLAVLPFSNFSGDADDASFSLGLADQLIDTIGRVPGLKVVARLSAMKARDVGMDLKGVGKLLGVSHVIEGSVQRSGSRIRCIAQLSHTKDSVRVWSQRFEHDTDREDDLFDFQDAIANAVLAAVSALHAPANPDVGSNWSINGLRPTNTENRDARDLFERARYLEQQRTLEGYQKAIALLERAVAIDPTFAQAYSHLGSAHANRTALIVEPTFPSFDHVKRAALRALELDPLDGDARALLGMVAYRIDYRWDLAEPMFHEGLRLAPNSVLVHSSYAWGLVFNGRFEEALRHTRLAQDLDPLNLGLRANNVAIALFARHYDLAISEFKAVIQLEADHVFSHVMLGMTYMSIGQHEVAMPHFEHVCGVMPNHFSPRFCRICVFGLRGDIERGKRDLEILLREIGDRHYSRFNLAMAQSCLGDLEGALKSLEYAAENRDVLFVSLPAHALLDRNREDPRYLGLLRRYGLPLLPPIQSRDKTLINGVVTPV
jgi:TolB-like protein